MSKPILPCSAAEPAAPLPQHSLRLRYLYKLFANTACMFLSLVTQAIVPRTLGPVAYGNFSFLNSFFSQLVGFLNTGTSTAFYSRLSQQPEDVSVIRFYWGYVLLIALAVALIIAWTFGVHLQYWVWPGQQAHLIWMAAGLACLSLAVGTVTGSIVDAYGLTASGEIARLLQAVASLTLVVLLLWLSRLHLAEYYLAQYVAAGGLGILWWSLLKRHGIQLFPRQSLSGKQIAGYASEFFNYSGPLLMSSLFCLFDGLLDRWLLEKTAGSEQQGFYGLSVQIGTICFLFTGSLTPLLIREFSKSYGDNDLERMRYLFCRYVPMLYSVAAFFSLFVVMQAANICLLFGGTKFSGAVFPIAIMAMYPIHQTYGQLNGSLLLATGRTRTYARIGMVTTLLAVPAAFLLIGPERWLGLNLRATGLASKMIAIQFVGVQLQLWFSTRLLRCSFWRLLWHQLYSLIILAAVAWGASAGAEMLPWNAISRFLLAGITYTTAVTAVLLLVPGVFAVSRREVGELFSRLWSMAWLGKVDRNVSLITRQRSNRL